MLRRSGITMRYFRDAYGCTASIRLNRDGSATLKIADAHGRPVHGKCHGTERGARIALGKYGDCWKEVTRHE